ncbi:Pyruvate kinase [Mycena chlorophos]|uniref:Pyruvate kinase n=1 Tax=Mycena chlorophos TaxID=658473 RepID=A0A8H6T4Q7_MYCCL|nr:Pyruvate kinase [Mycena chlorophos]
MSSFTKRRRNSSLFGGRLPHHITVPADDKSPYRDHARNHSWFIAVPGLGPRRLLLNPRRAHQLAVSRFGRRAGLILILAGLVFLLLALLNIISFVQRLLGRRETTWPTFVRVQKDPPTLVFRREELQRIWAWEVSSGHYPSRKRIPEQIWLDRVYDNPGLPPRRGSVAPGTIGTATRGVGARRVYLDTDSANGAPFPPRPVPGSLADLDIIMEHCDFSAKKFVRDCLEVLRYGGGLDNGNRLRRGKMDDWKYLYLPELPILGTFTSDSSEEALPGITKPARDATVDPDAGLTKKKGVDWEPSLRDQLPPARKYLPITNANPCDPENPRIFHMFWVGPFTDKPYMALLSFLFTQNTGLHLDGDAQDDSVCRPVFWLWINIGPAAAVPNPSALDDMYTQLKANPWAAPFLHPRFHHVIQFKLWNTTEQLDGVPELRDEWRSHVDTLFNSGGHIINVPKEKASASASANDTEASEMLNRLGSKSANTYDRMSVILSDMARFILCHRFGGIYLDADTILLRDWEEMWQKMAFAYRWSRLEKYNTAVLHLNKGSALGTFLFRTALKNDLDFHPMTVSRYLRDAYLEGLLLRLPDALFDSAWLNVEYFQRNRPPSPFFTEYESSPFFADFFDTPVSASAGPQSLGFDGFFRGAYSYHYHNAWWKPFDSVRNWPDLGPRFIAAERLARANLRSTQGPASTASPQLREGDENSDPADPRDLDWSMVLMRTFQSYVRGERPNMYGEWMNWHET